MTVTREQIQAAIHAIDGGSVYVDLPNNGGVDVRKTIRTVLQSALSATKTPATAALDAFYNGTTEDALSILEKSLKHLSSKGIMNAAAPKEGEL